jgi:undecaprenyl-diphosphatase
VAKPGRELLAGFLAAVGALAIFAWLAEHVARQQTIEFDAAIRGWLHGLASPPLTAAFRAITFCGSGYFLIPFGAVLVWRLWQEGSRTAAALYVTAVAGGEALLGVLKLVFHRPRPPVFFGLDEPNSYSFPSGHAMLAACFFGVAAAIVAARPGARRYRLWIWVAAAAASLLIGISRIYLGMHYPSDVVAGYAAAVIWVSSVRLEYQARVRRQRADSGPRRAA